MAVLALQGKVGLARHDVLHGLGDVGLGQIPHPSIAQQGNDVPLDASDIGGDRGELLRPSSFAEDKPVLQIFEEAAAEFLECDRLTIELALPGGVSALAT